MDVSLESKAGDWGTCQTLVSHTLHLFSILAVFNLEIMRVMLSTISLIVSAIEKDKATSERLKYDGHKEVFVNDLIQRLEQHCFVKRGLS